MKKKIKRYTKEQLDFLRSGYMSMTLSTLTLAFNKHFSLEKTVQQIKSTTGNHNMVCGRAPKDRLYKPFLKYTEDQVAFLIQNCTGRLMPELTQMYNDRFKTNKSVSELRSFLKNRRINSGVDTKFKNGQKSWNKGTKGLTQRNRTTFKKGNIPANVVPLGTERIDTRDGSILIKIKEKNPYTGAPTRFKHKSVVVWERANGPVPKDMAIIFKDGDKTNCNLDNLVLVTKAELLRLNQHGYKYFPEQIKPSVLALAKLETKTFQKIKKQEEKNAST
jgi:hypothetical protein